jgi:sulfide:quinone oxidoreductase
MWMAWDRFRRTDRGDKVSVGFFTGMPTMFAVKKYSDVLNALREERKIGGYFQHNLVAVNSKSHKATFQTSDGSTVDVDYSTLHVTPPMGPLEFIKESPLADAAGWVSVDPGTLQHTNPEYANVFSVGDCSSLPTSKTAAAITAQAPVLTENVFSFLEKGKVSNACYDGYTSCPV